MLGLLLLLASSALILSPLKARGAETIPLEDVALAVYYKQADFQLSPLYYAQVNGYYTIEGVRMTIYYAGSNEEALRLLEQGRVHAALLRPVEVVRSIYNNRQLGIFLQYMQDSPYAVVATAVPELYNPEDLAGKTIGFEVGNYDARLALSLFLKRYNLSGSVTLVQTATDPINDLQNRSVDAAVTSRIPVAGILDGQDIPYFVWRAERRGDTPVVGDAFVALRTYLSDENRGLLRRFSRATLKGMQDIVRAPDRAAWDVLLPYQREFSISQIQAVRKELKLLADYLQGDQAFALLGTATTQKYDYFLNKLIEIKLLANKIPPNRLFVF